MLVGAHCRDVLHARQGWGTGLRTTDDLDLGVALADWTAFRELTGRLTHTGHTGVRFDVDGMPIDLMPFGSVEDPVGEVTPRPRDEPMSVWGFQEVFDHADTLLLPTAGPIRLPTIPGYVALKLAAWLDRSAWGKYKDAGDIAAAMLWYVESDVVNDRLYADDAGTEILLQYDVDPTRGAVHLLGQDVAALLGTERHRELRARWPGERGALLPVEMTLPPGTRWPRDVGHRFEWLNALESGLALEPTRRE